MFSKVLIALIAAETAALNLRRNVSSGPTALSQVKRTRTEPVVPQADARYPHARRAKSADAAKIGIPELLKEFGLHAEFGEKEFGHATARWARCISKEGVGFDEKICDTDCSQDGDLCNAIPRESQSLMGTLTMSVEDLWCSNNCRPNDFFKHAGGKEFDHADFEKLVLKLGWTVEHLKKLKVFNAQKKLKCSTLPKLTTDKKQNCNGAGNGQFCSFNDTTRKCYAHDPLQPAGLLENDGLRPADIDFDMCAGGSYCYGHGECNPADGKCTCADDYTGEECNVPPSVSE